MSQTRFANQKQPAALWILSAITMWERFSYYGMRGLLILFLTQSLGFQDASAYQIYGAYCALVSALALMGAYAADRFIGIFKSTQLGCITVCLGHLLMMLLPESLFAVGLSVIIVGTGLFRTNITALLGMHYPENDPRQPSGFTYYFSIHNLGGFLSGVLCAWVAYAYGYSYGFGLAAIGMIFGLMLFAIGKPWIHLPKADKNLQWKEFSWVILGMTALVPVLFFILSNSGFFYNYLSLLFIFSAGLLLKNTLTLSLEAQKKIIPIAIGLVFFVLFYAVEEQAGSSLILFANRFSDQTLPWIGKIPVASLISMNPLTIILIGPLVARWSQSASLASVFRKIALGAGLAALGYGLLYSFNSLNTSVTFLLLVYALVALGELLVGPSVIALCARNSPAEMRAQFMGLMTLGAAASNYVSAFLNRLVASPSQEAPLDAQWQVYQYGFLFVLILLVSMSALSFGIAWIMGKKEKPSL